MPKLLEVLRYPSTGSGDTPTVDRVPTISKEELRENTDEILRRAEAGEKFTVTVSGHPVAELGPRKGQRWVSGDVLVELWNLPVDPGYMRDIENFGFGLRNPWEE